MPEPAAERTTVAIELARASTTSKNFKADEEPAEKESLSTPEVGEETVTETNSTGIHMTYVIFSHIYRYTILML